MLEGKILTQYANLVIKLGVNLQKGQGLEILCPTECSKVAQALTIAGYEAGAKIVRVRWENENIDKLNYTYANTEDLIKVTVCIVLHVFLTLLVAYENNHHKAEHHAGH